MRLTSPYLGVAAAFAIAISARAQDSIPAPARFWAAQTAPDSISINWSVVPGVRYYRLYSIPASGTATAIGESRGATADWWVFPIKVYGQPLRFAIEAVSESGVVSPRVTSNEVVPERTTLGPTPPAPATARASASSNGTVTVTWDVVPGATGYTISRTAIPGGNRVVCRLCAPTGSFVDTYAVSGSKHTYRVVAITPKGTSRGVVSNEVTPSGGTAPTAASVPTAARGTLHLTPSPGSCLSLGQEGNFVVRLADGSVRQYQRVTFDNGMRLVPNPTLGVVPGISDAVAVSTSAHSLALRSDGTILAWGPNGHGELGSEQAIDRRFGRALPQFSRLPVPVREIGNAVAVGAGSEHSVALLADGTIRTWGSGEYGIPGDGVLETRMGYNHLAPTKVIGIDSAVKISTGGNSTFALLKDGSIRAWGNNLLPLGAKGVLGTIENQTTAVPTPVQGISNAVDVVATGGGGAALLADGTLRAWGSGYGPGHRPQDQATNKPVMVEGIRGAIALSPNMVLMPDGSVRDFPFQPSWATPKLTNAVAIASGGPNRFALLADGQLVAWGHKRWYPNGMVTLATLGPDTARRCAARPG